MWIDCAIIQFQKKRHGCSPGSQVSSHLPKHAGGWTGDPKLPLNCEWESVCVCPVIHSRPFMVFPCLGSRFWKSANPRKWKRRWLYLKFSFWILCSSMADFLTAGIRLCPFHYITWVKHAIQWAMKSHTASEVNLATYVTWSVAGR